LREPPAPAIAPSAADLQAPLVEETREAFPSAPTSSPLLSPGTPSPAPKVPEKVVLQSGPKTSPAKEVVLTPENSPTATQPREPKEYIISIYSNTDLRPPSYTIHVGDTITFINFDNTLHWPGSDPHPTHSSLPEFDALGGIAEGQSYSYTFGKIDIYGYHEHLIEDAPTIGFITVLE